MIKKLYFEIYFETIFIKKLLINFQKSDWSSIFF